ncbi:MAG: hypothetical protein M1820_000798 [Bogoriella megaspora]|nr:MAG: hypothetical protein M1820_000798 [Bogoriella megaspora]
MAGNIIIISDSEDEKKPRPSKQLQHKSFDRLHAPQSHITETQLNESNLLRKISDIFPNIEQDFVIRLYRNVAVESGASTDQYANIVEHLLQLDSYPKESSKTSQLKRKEAIGNGHKENRKSKYRKLADPDYFTKALVLLKNEFPSIPEIFLESELEQNGRLFAAYCTIENTRQWQECSGSGLYTKMGTPRTTSYAELCLIQSALYAPLRKELEAAKLARSRQMRRLNKRTIVEPAKKDPRSNVAAAGTTAPATVWSSVKALRPTLSVTIAFDNMLAVKSESPIGRFALNGIVNDAVLHKLDRLQQQEEIKAAGLNNLEECPFCDYQAVYPPVEVDREFRCENFHCKKTSCRKCRLETHVPLSCEEFADDHKINARHKLEEAMTEALVRQCNKCGNRFIKVGAPLDFSAHKLADSEVTWIYCCGSDITDYQHFHESEGRCPVFDKDFDRHESDVKKAEKTALEKIRTENPEFSSQDLQFKVSEVVRQEEARQKREAEIRTRENAALDDPQMLNGVQGFNFAAPVPLRPPDVPNLFPRPFPEALPAYPPPPRFRRATLAAATPGPLPFVDGPPQFPHPAHFPGCFPRNMQDLNVFAPFQTPAQATTRAPPVNASQTKNLTATTQPPARPQAHSADVHLYPTPNNGNINVNFQFFQPPSNVPALPQIGNPFPPPNYNPTVGVARPHGGPGFQAPNQAALQQLNHNNMNPGELDALEMHHMSSRRGSGNRKSGKDARKGHK